MKASRPLAAVRGNSARSVSGRADLLPRGRGGGRGWGQKWAPGPRNGPGARAHGWGWGRADPLSRGQDRDQETGAGLTRLPRAGERGPGAGGPARARARGWGRAGRARAADSVISELWLSSISAVVIEARATDMNSVLPLTMILVSFF